MPLFYSIAKVAEMLDVKPSYLRYIEKEFSFIKPYKDKHGNRRYTDKDLEIIRRIIYLRSIGYTMDGVKEQMKRVKTQDQAQDPSNMDNRLEVIENLQQIRFFLEEIKKEL